MNKDKGFNCRANGTTSAQQQLKHEEIARDIAEFLQRGGQIETVAVPENAPSKPRVQVSGLSI